MEYDKTSFGTTKQGENVEQVILTNDHNVKVKILTYGALWQSFEVPTDNNEMTNLLVSYDNLRDYEDSGFYLCKTVGRVAGRIGHATYSIDGNEYYSDDNENGNTLHGGPKGLSDRVWKVSEFNQRRNSVSVTLTVEVNSFEDHFLGDMQIDVTYTLDNNDAVTWKITGLSDQKTLFNPTLHTYFNLTDQKTLSSQELWINGNHRLELDSSKIPTGKLLGTDNTPYDFYESHNIIDNLHHLDSISGIEEYDDAFYVNGNNDDPIATVSDPMTNRAIDIYSNRNALIVFTADVINYQNDSKTKIDDYTGLALEAQWLPDAIHNDGFGDIVLPADVKQTYEIKYQYHKLHE